MPDRETIEAYRAAWEDWQKQLAHVHRVFLEGEPLGPDRMKGLLNREARKKAAYDEARARLLGIDQSEAPLPSGDVNPFKQ